MPKINATTLLHLKKKTAIILEAEKQPGLVVKGLSRLPVTEEIAGSNPVEPATKQRHHLMAFFRTSLQGMRVVRKAFLCHQEDTHRDKKPRNTVW
jgi:hypothetical protein